jgi:N-methylhydantoinase B
MIAIEVDPVTLEVVRNRLDAIADEMQYVLLRSSYSIVIKEAGDATSALFSVGGEAIAHSVAIPAHLGVMAPAVGGIVERFPLEEMCEGDVFLMNDPYSGGTHLPDVTVVVPVISGGRVIGLSVAMSHHQEMGGMVASSMPAHSTEIFQEGLILPPLRLYERGEANETLLRLIAANVRLPDDVLGDLRGQVAATRTGAARLLELVGEYGEEQVLAYADELLDRAERMTRAEIRKIPEGTYRFHDFLDHDGIERDRLVRIEAAITIRDGDFIVDFTGTDPQTKGPVNGPPSSAFSAAAYVLRAISDPSIPINGGSERPIKLVLPEGTVVNPRFPAPVCLRGHLIRRTVDVLLGALVQALPERMPACSASINGAHSFSGVDPASGRYYGTTDTNIVSGQGALPWRDGTDVIEMHTTNLLSVPTEWFELSAPLLVHRNRLRPDSGGAGRYRGGVGIERVLELRRGSAVSCFRHERHRTGSWGLFGGQAGARWSASLRRAGGSVEPVPGKVVFEMGEGDLLTILTGGGGGYGDPLERDPDAVLRDWREGKVSLASARATYGVLIDEQNGSVDTEATAALRADLRKQKHGNNTQTVDRGDGQRDYGDDAAS